MSAAVEAPHKPEPSLDGNYPPHPPRQSDDGHAGAPSSAAGFGPTPRPEPNASDERGGGFGDGWGRLRVGEEPFAERRESLRDATPELDPEPSAVKPAGAPAAGNQNATAASARTPAELMLEFDDEAFEAQLRGEAWTAPQPAAAARRRDPPMPESVIDGASALLSAQAGEQVASAFADLARAIREGQMRSMEDMAREMLRPMLQEWLDDNLPRMVERLVREEIERIARGPHR